MKNNAVNGMINRVIGELGLDDSARCTYLRHENGLYEMEIRTLVMRYDVYADDASGEIMGLNYEPSVDEDAVFGEINRVA